MMGFGMIDMQIQKHPLTQTDAATYVLFAPKSGLNEEQKTFLHGLDVDFEALAKKHKFEMAQGSILACQGRKNGAVVEVLVAGLGELYSENQEKLAALRQAIGKVVRYFEKTEITAFSCDVPSAEMFGVDAFALAEEIAASFLISKYQFNLYITDKKRHVAFEYQITLVAREAEHDAIRTGWERGIWEGFAVNQARLWSDMPPCDLTPTLFAEYFAEIASAHPNLNCSVFTKKEIQDLGMGGLLAVSAGSSQDPRFIIAEYQPEGSYNKTIGLVGKGVTFDSGGISIKPSQNLDEMKDDMAGAGAVLATMQAIAHLKPHVRVIAAVPMTENMLGGAATKPGDIIYHYNGKTSEIKNTDAEGRLILADALAYICKNYELDFLIDLATLTGACAYALGPFYAGLMTKDIDLEKRLVRAGRSSGDKVWPLPFTDEYKSAVVSDVADVCNIGKSGYRAGAITAGMFLRHFVDEKISWAHIDIAGVSFKVPDKSYLRSNGATGFGVRFLVSALMNWK